jgi:hypothetical protein
MANTTSELGAEKQSWSLNPAPIDPPCNPVA